MKKLLAFALLAYGFSSASHAAQIISPFAADLSASSYTSNSQYLNFSAEDAFNGGIWNAGNYGWNWIQADMGSVQTLTELKITIAQSPNGITEHQVFLSDSSIGSDYINQSSIFSQSGYTVAGTVLDVLFDTPQSGRYLLILSNGGPSWTALGDQTGRIDWVQPVVSAVPVPAAVWLFGSGLIGLVGIARRKV